MGVRGPSREDLLRKDVDLDTGLRGLTGQTIVSSGQAGLETAALHMRPEPPPPCNQAAQREGCGADGSGLGHREKEGRPSQGRAGDRGRLQDGCKQATAQVGHEYRLD